jgi:hypothetical protein
VLETNPECLAGVEDYGAIRVPADVLVFAGKNDHESNEEDYHWKRKCGRKAILLLDHCDE